MSFMQFVEWKRRKSLFAGLIEKFVAKFIIPYVRSGEKRKHRQDQFNARQLNNLIISGTPILSSRL